MCPIWPTGDHPNTDCDPSRVREVVSVKWTSQPVVGELVSAGVWSLGS